MKFIMGESGWAWLERVSYRGGIGIFYDSTGDGVLAYVIFGLVCILTLIGLATVIKLLLCGLPNKKKSKKW